MLKKRIKISPFTGKEEIQSESIAPAQLFNYSLTEVEEIEDFKKEGLKPFEPTGKITWINLHSIDDLAFIQQIGKAFSLETLTLDKIIDLEQRPKMEEFEHYLYLSTKTLWVNEDVEIETEQISFVLGRGWLLSFQEKDADLFDEVRERLRNDQGIVRSRRSGYLLYLLLDAITDNYRNALEHLQNEMEDLSTRIIYDEDEDVLPEVEAIKTELNKIKRNVAPLKDVVTSLHNGDSEILLPETVRFIGNVRDHLVSIIEDVDTQRQTLEGLFNIHLTNLNNRMNEVMKVLTVIATIFIPLTFIAGIYGMNCQFMPELNFKYGYFGVLGVMFIVLVLMLVYFKRKGWF
jgi:magnesium transporter